MIITIIRLITKGYYVKFYKFNSCYIAYQVIFL
jgi:hypothetical protein